MSVPQTLESLRSRGLTVELVAGRLRVGPRERIDDAIRELIRREAAGIVASLARALEAPAESFDYAAALAPDYECVAGPVDPRSDPFRGVTPAELAESVRELGALNRASAGQTGPPEPKPKSPRRAALAAAP